MFARLLFLAASCAKLKHVVSRGALVGPLKKKREPADAGVGETAMGKRLATTIAAVTVQIDLGLESDLSMM
jgi:hypothetical protein